ncbi:hypothetical protein [Rossellomorea marisflavi]|nr:hypothetical protein [Rossellomorea marisflavi]
MDEKYSEWQRNMVDLGMEAKVLLELNEKDPERFSEKEVLKALRLNTLI